MAVCCTAYWNIFSSFLFLFYGKSIFILIYYRAIQNKHSPDHNSNIAKTLMQFRTRDAAKTQRLAGVSWTA